MTDVEWRKAIFDFFTLDGAAARRDKLATWPGGRLVVHTVDMPIKCLGAPLRARSRIVISSRGSCP